MSPIIPAATTQLKKKTAQFPATAIIVLKESVKMPNCNLPPLRHRYTNLSLSIFIICNWFSNWARWLREGPHKTLYKSARTPSPTPFQGGLEVEYLV